MKPRIETLTNRRFSSPERTPLFQLRRIDFGDLFALAYLVFFLLEPVARRSTRYWLECIPILLLFLALWFSFLYSRTDITKRWIVVIVALLGVCTMPLNPPGGVCFLIYVVSLLPYSVTVLNWQLSLMLADLLLLYAEERWFHFPASAMFYTLFFAMVGGGANLFFAEKERNTCRLQRKEEEIEALGALAERERIARDLHDVLGHTLSLIVLKSELAHRLLERELAAFPALSSQLTELSSRSEAEGSAFLHPATNLSSRAERSAAEGPGFAPAHAQRSPNLATLRRACAEIADVERTARTALSEVREAIGGYRARGLTAEIENARHALTAAGVTLVSEGDLQPANLTAAEETVLALALREAVTNIVRHAEATECRLRLIAQNGHQRLSIQDNGSHTLAHEGNGLRGMRERVESLGGHLSLTRDPGTHLLIELPLRTSPAT